MNAPFDATKLDSLKFGIGQPVPRNEDPTLLKGEGRYTDDVSLPNQAYCVMVRSQVAHGIVKGIDATDAVQCSAKSGVGVIDVLESLIERVPAPTGNPAAPLKALIIDSWFDNYLGVVSLVRIFDGELVAGAKIRIMSTGRDAQVDQVGIFTPKRVRRERLSAGEVMRIAQGLYESGYITYMRTDNVGLSDEALAAVRAEITSTFGDKFVPAEPRTYKSKVKNAQEAHEAIRPTLPLRSPDSLRGELNPVELNVYRLVWQRTLASQMGDAQGTTLMVRLGAEAKTAEPADCEFSASGTTITKPGYRLAYEESSDEEESEDIVKKEP